MKHAIILGIVGATLVYCGWLLEWWGLPLIWFAESFLLLAMGHAGLGPRVFGKRPDGTIPLWNKILHAPFLVCMNAIQFMAVAVSSENAVDQVSEGLLIGRRLRAKEVPGGIVNYVDLTAELEDPKEIRERPGYVCFPILDASVPSMAALKTAVTNLASGPTYVHCAQGHGRSALFVIAFLAYRGEIHSVAEGLSRLKTARPGVRLNSTQRKYIRKELRIAVSDRPRQGPKLISLFRMVRWMTRLRRLTGVSAAGGIRPVL